MSERCGALSGNGTQCRRKAIGRFSYHGDCEIYADHVATWVIVPFCFFHVQDVNRLPHDKDMRRMRKAQKIAKIASDKFQRERKKRLREAR